MRLFAWEYYSSIMQQKILSPRNGGILLEEEALTKDLFLAKGSAGSLEEGNYLCFYWMVDPKEGTIVDATYQALGQSALIAAAECAVDLLVQKNYDQARRISAELLENVAKDKQGRTFPQETYPHLNIVLDAIDDTADQCLEIPLPTSYLAPPKPSSHFTGESKPYPGFELMSMQEQVQVIDEVLDREVRPYIALDAGGVEVLQVIEHTQVRIAYQGSCTSCHASTGATLSYIQQVLRSHIHPLLVVVPEGPGS